VEVCLHSPILPCVRWHRGPIGDAATILNR
jgi:hypothetical protein